MKPEEIIKRLFLAKDYFTDEQALRALHAATIAALPKEKRKMTYVDAMKDVKLWELATHNAGYNQAIDQMKAAIDKLYGMKSLNREEQ